jgi:CDP-diacylglycerol--serine O-phosphatidyltransferase
MNPTPSGTTGAPGRIHPLPSLLTLCNAFCGFTSLIIALNSHAPGNPIPQACIWLLLGSLIFDTLDGLAARGLNAKSRHGAHLDSLSDALSFGVAPAAIAFVCANRFSGDHPRRLGLVLGVSLFYLGCALWRLARFNSRTTEDKKDATCFIGLPSPAAAGLIYSAGWLMTRLPLEEPARFQGILGFTVLTGLLMVSHVPYPHARRFVSPGAPIPSAALVVTVLASVALCRVPAMVTWAYIYFLFAPLVYLRPIRTPAAIGEAPAVIP